MQDRIRQLNQLGKESILAGDFLNAKKIFKQMANEFPDEPTVYANLGQCCYETGDHLGAISNYEAALKIDPKKFALLQNRLYLLYRNAANFEKAKQIESSLDQSGLEEPLISLMKDEDPKKNWGIAKARTSLIKTVIEYQHKRQVHKKRIKLGYISSDFREHPIAQIIEGVFRYHDKRKFELHLFSTGEDDGSSWRKRIIKTTKYFYNVSKLNDGQLARMIREREIDILVDLNGHTDGSRLFALAQKPAPIIVNYLGFPGTMATSFHDYIIADKLVIPPREKKYFTEQIKYLPYTYQPTNCFWKKIKGSLSREIAGLPAKKIVFACFVSTLRIDEQDINNWCEILNKVPNSVLWLKENEQAKENIISYFVKAGVNRERILWAQSVSSKRMHLERMSLADLCLDTGIYGGHTTTIDFLWSGVPVLTKYGKHFASRVASSVLSTHDLKELITYSDNEYIAKAVSLGSNVQVLTKLKERLKSNFGNTPLFKTKEYTTHLEKIYRKIYEER